MLLSSNLILTVSPADTGAAAAYQLPIAHIAYRVGGGPHLFRASLPVAPRGGYMVIDDTGFTPLGAPTGFCHEVLRECPARDFTGVVCAFENRPTALLGDIIASLDALLAARGWPLYIPECYAQRAAHAKVLIPTALSGGSLRQRLEEAAARYTADRVALAVERTAQDFFLPSPTGQGIPLTAGELQTMMEERSPSVFFSDELCAHYFTYMSRQDGAHFILFDNAHSIRKKLHIARSLDISDALLPFSQVGELLPDILA